MPNPSVVSGNSNSGSFTTGTSVTVSSTGSVTAGNLMMCVLTVGGASAPSALAPPAGWTTFLTTTANTASGLIVTAIFYRAAPSSGAFSGSFTWTTTATSGAWGFFVLNQAGALLVDGAVVTAQNASGTKTSPTITPGAGKVNDTLICAIIGAVAGVDSITQPAGMTSIVNIAGTSTQPFFSIASLALASSAATGTKTWTVPTSQTCLGVSLLVQQGPIWGFNVVNDAAPALPSYESRIAQRHAARGRSEFGIFPMPFKDGWAMQPQDPKPPKQFRAGAIAVIGGIEAKMLSPAPPTSALSETQIVYPRLFPTVKQRHAATKGKSEFAVYPNWVFGWDAQLPPGRNGNPSIYQRAAGASGDSTFASFDMGPWTEVQGWQPPYPRTAHRASPLVVGDPGNEAKFVPPAVTVTWGFEPPPIVKRNAYRSGIFTERDVETPLIGFFPFGWMVQPVQPGHPSPEKRSAGIARGADGIEAVKFASFSFGGWEAQPIQPGHPAPEKRSGAIARGDEGNAAPQINFFPAGWQVQPHQPQHLRPERAGAIMAGDPGNEAPFVFVSPLFVPDGYNPTAFMPRVRFAKAGSLARGEDGTEGVYSVWLASGWQMPDPTQRARRGTAGAIQDEWRGEQPLLATPQWSFEFQSVMLRRQAPRQMDQATTVLAAGTPIAVTVSWGDFNPDVRYPARRRANVDQAPFVPSALAVFTWGDLDAGVLARTRRRLRPDEAPFSPHALGARFSWGEIDPAMTLPTRRRTLTRADFHIEGKFVFVPPPPVTYTSNPDNLLRRTLFNPGAAIMQFDGGWFQQRYVDVFFASSIITQASGDTAVTAASGQTVLSNQA